MKEFRILHKHKVGCLAIKNVLSGNWGSPWVLAEHKFLGEKHKKGYYMWRCNDPDCEAQMAVRDYVVDNLIYRLTRRA